MLRASSYLAAKNPFTSYEYTLPCTHNGANLNANPDIPITQPQDVCFTTGPATLAQI